MKIRTFFLPTVTAVLLCVLSFGAANAQSKTDKEYETKKAGLYQQMLDNNKWHNSNIPPIRIRAMKIKKQIDSLNRLRDSLMRYSDSLIAVSNANSDRINNDINSLRREYCLSSESALTDVYSIRRGHKKDSLEKILANLDPKIRKGKAAKRIREYLTQEPLKEGDRFWEFPCYTLDGKRFDWKKTRGNKMLIILDGFDCMSFHMDPLAFKKYADQNIAGKIKEGSGFVFLPFLYAKDKEEFQKMAKFYGLEEYRPVSDLEGKLSKIEITYGVTATPMCLYINPNGTIHKITEGFDPEDVDKFLK